MQSKHAIPVSSRREGSAKRRIAVNLLLLGISLSALALGAEVALRLLFAKELRLVQDDRSLLYKYDSTLGWFPLPGTTNQFRGSRTIHVAHNSQGFRDPEMVVDSRPGILFAGDSFVWGYDVEAEERFTDRLRAKHPEWRIHNIGVSGYGTDQEFLLLQMKCALFRPRLIFLVYNPENDDDDNRSNARYGGYYKPYCTVSGQHLEIHGIPVPKGERAFLAEHWLLARSYLARLGIRAYYRLTLPPVLQNPSPTGAILQNIRDFAQSQGSSFAIGLVTSTPGLEEQLRSLQVPFVDLTTELRFPSLGNHWTAEGHALAAKKIEDFLLAHRILLEKEAATTQPEK